MLKENRYQESIITKIFKRITNNHNLPQSNQLTQATDIQEEEIRMSINLPYVEGTSEKLRRILRSHKTRSTFYTENTLCKLLHKPQDQVVTEDKNNIVYEVHCSEVVYFGKSNRVQMNTKDLSGIATGRRKKLQNTVGKQITTLAGMGRKLSIGKAG